jgi:hypothetical protein
MAQLNVFDNSFPSIDDFEVEDEEVTALLEDARYTNISLILRTNIPL